MGQRNFVVEPIHYENALINHQSEREFLADKSAKQIASWQADKSDADGVFFQHLAANSAGLNVVLAAQPPGPGTFVLRPICTSIETGALTAVNAPTEMRLTVQVLDSRGELIDEIASAIAVAAQIWNPSSGGRLRQAGAFHGTQIANYLHLRTGL
jgi:hypothetical protein